MAKEYTKKNKTHPRTSTPWLLALTAFFCGYLSGNLFNLSELAAWIKTNVASEDKKEAMPKPANVQAKLPKPKFEFYTLLTQEESVTPAISHAVPAESRPSAPKEMTAVKQAAPVKTERKENKENYVVQIASFNKKQDAERMKASLILKGFNVAIVSVKRQNMEWFRVMMGPFPNRIEAEKAQVDVARSERVMGLIRKMDA